MINLPDANQQLAALLELMQAASYAHDPYDLAERVGTSLGGQLETIATSVWLYAPPQHVCLYTHNLSDTTIREQLEHTFATGTAVFSELDWHAAPQPATYMLSIFPLAVEQTIRGALAIVTPAPLDHSARLLLQALAAYLGARFQATQTQQAAERAQIEQAASDDGWNEFISHAAHEIKNPLASVKGYADLLLRRTSEAPSDPFRKGLTIISQQTARATDLLSAMSDTARIDSDRLMLNKQTADLTALVERVIEEQAASANQHHIALGDQDAPLRCYCDTARLTQVLQAMLSNAIKFSPHGSSIQVQLRQTTNQGKPEAVLSVADQGVGVPADEQREVFERFKRGSNIRGQYSGLGLGLFAAREIVKRHDGRMWLESEVGQGTTCFVALPLSETRPESA